MQSAVATAPAIPPVPPSIAQLCAELEALPTSRVLTEAEAEALYALAHRESGQGRYPQALNYFALLWVFKPTHPKYMRGLGVTLRKLERHEQALQVFRYLEAIDPGRVQHALDTADCLVRLRRPAQAVAALEDAVRRCSDAAAVGLASQRAQALRQLLTRKLSHAA